MWEAQQLPGEYVFKAGEEYEPFAPFFEPGNTPGPRKVRRAQVAKRRAANKSARKARKANQ